MDNKIILTLFDDNIMSALFRAGFISPKVFLYRDIYLWVDAQITVRGITKTQAVIEATEKFNKSESRIWIALKCFDQ